MTPGQPSLKTIASIIACSLSILAAPLAADAQQAGYRFADARLERLPGVEFDRRWRQPLLPGIEAYFAQPEDVILNKLLYFQEGGSERHLRDIAGMLRVSGPEIDTRYIGDWAQRLGVEGVWQAVRERGEGK